MNIIVRYIIISLKKNFINKMNAVMVILDTVLACFSIWLFWNSLLEMDLQIEGWGISSIQMFIGFSLIARAFTNLTVGDYDIQQHIAKGTLDNFLVKPCNPIIAIMMERPDFLQFFVTFFIGLICVFIHCDGSKIGYALIAIFVCIIATITLCLLEVMIFEGAFWLKKTDMFADVYFAISSVSKYPLVFFGKKITLFLTYILPVAYVGTIPTEITAGGVLSISILVPLLLLGINLLGVTILWKLGRRRYESTN